MSNVHTVSVNFYQNGGVDIYEAFNDIWGFIHKGSSPQSSAFARNVIKTLDEGGYAAKMPGINSIEFRKVYP